MNVYDFDNTIYDGDCSIDFFLYSIKKHPKLIFNIPKIVIGFFLNWLNVIDRKSLKEIYFSFVKNIKDIDDLIFCFCKEHEFKIKKWYLMQHKKDDVIISASPEFLVATICNNIGIKNVIASNVDKYTGQFISENCYGEMKVVYLHDRFSDILIDNFYSDSISDLPLAKIAKNAYIVKGDKILKWLIK